MTPEDGSVDRHHRPSYPELSLTHFSLGQPWTKIPPDLKDPPRSVESGRESHEPQHQISPQLTRIGPHQRRIPSLQGLLDPLEEDLQLGCPHCHRSSPGPPEVEASSESGFGMFTQPRSPLILLSSRPRPCLVCPHVDGCPSVHGRETPRERTVSGSVDRDDGAPSSRRTTGVT